MGEAAFLLAAVDELNRITLHEVEDQLGDCAGASDSGGGETVELGSHPVERAEEREFETLHAVSPDDAVEHLLGAGVDPALHADRAENELGVVLVEGFLVAHCVDFGSGGEDDALVVFDAVADDAQVLFKVEFKDFERIAGVLNRGRDGDERENDVAFFDVVFDPFAVNGDIAFGEVEVGVGEQFLNVVGTQVHAVDFIFAACKQTLADGAADESVDAENQDALFAFRTKRGGIGDELHLLHQTAVFHQLFAGGVETVCSLGEVDFDRTASAGDRERLRRENRARFRLCGFCGKFDFGDVPDQILLVAEEAECAGIGAGHAADEVADVGRGPGPVDRSVGGFALAEVGGFLLVLLFAFDFCFGFCELGQFCCEQFGCGFCGFQMNVFRSVVCADGDFLLRDDVARVNLFGHDMECDAGFFFAVDDGPVDGSASAVFREQGAVEVQSAF